MGVCGGGGGWRLSQVPTHRRPRRPWPRPGREGWRARRWQRRRQPAATSTCIRWPWRMCMSRCFACVTHIPLRVYVWPRRAGPAPTGIAWHAIPIKKPRRCAPPFHSAVLALCHAWHPHRHATIARAHLLGPRSSRWARALRLAHQEVQCAAACAQTEHRQRAMPPHDGLTPGHGFKRTCNNRDKAAGRTHSHSHSQRRAAHVSAWPHPPRWSSTADSVRPPCTPRCMHDGMMA